MAAFFMPATQGRISRNKTTLCYAPRFLCRFKKLLLFLLAAIATMVFA
jgi:hypothetical protein